MIPDDGFDPRTARAWMRRMGLPVHSAPPGAYGGKNVFAYVDAYDCNTEHVHSKLADERFPYRVAESRQVARTGRRAAFTRIYLCT